MVVSSRCVEPWLKMPANELASHSWDSQQRGIGWPLRTNWNSRLDQVAQVRWRWGRHCLERQWRHLVCHSMLDWQPVERPQKWSGVSSTSSLIAVINGVWAVKLCSNEIVQLLTGNADFHRSTCIMTVKWLLWFVRYVSESGAWIWNCLYRSRWEENGRHRVHECNWFTLRWRQEVTSGLTFVFCTLK